MAQCPPNLDFESGGFIGWSGFTGANPGTGVSGIYTSTTIPGFVIPQRHAITPTNYNGVAGMDPVGNFPVVAPLGGNFSCILGSENICTGSGGNYKEEKLTYTFMVPAGMNNFYLTFLYAVVLENPCDASHTANNNAATPWFVIRAKDLTTGAVISCDSLPFNPCNSTLPGFTAANACGRTWQYKPWSSGLIRLSGIPGHSILIEAVAADCGFGGHDGYGYFDFLSLCSNNAIVSGYCPGSSTATFTGPGGFATYTWMDSAMTTILGTNDTLILPVGSLPTTGTLTVNLAITPFGGYGCPDTLVLPITLSPGPQALTAFIDSYCINTPLQFWDSSTAGGAGSFLVGYQWNFGDPNCPAAQNVSTLQNPVHVYSQLGTYNVQLIVLSFSGCTDTLDTIVHITNVPPVYPLTASPDTICGNQPTVLHWGGSAQAGYQYAWNINGGDSLAGNFFWVDSITCSWTSPGMHTATITANPIVPSAQGCQSVTSVNVFVQGLAPTFYLDGNDSICLNQNTTITAYGSPQNCGASIIPCTNGAYHNVGAFTSTTNNLPTPFLGWYMDGRIQMYFTPAELIAAGMTSGGPITEIAWEVISKASTIPYNSFTISMGCSPNSVFNTAAFDATTATSVVYGPVAYSTTTGMNNFILNTPYDWDGVSNLLVDVCFDNSSWTGWDYVKTTTLVPARVAYDYADLSTTSGCNALTTPLTSTIRPDTRFRACGGYIPAGATINWTIPPSTTSIGTGTSITVSPAVSTVYRCTISDNGCPNYKDFAVNVLTVNTVSAGLDDTICSNSPVTLVATATGPLPPSPLTCGANNTICGTPAIAHVVGLGTDNTNVNTITTSNTDGRMLFIYRKADIIAATAGGITVASTISQLAFNILTKNTTGNFANFTIKMGCVPLNTALPADFYPSGTLTTVYGPATFTPVVGWNAFNLSSVYDWNGNSDIAIEICYNNVILQAGNLADVYEKTNTGLNNTAMVAYVNSPTGSGCTLSFLTATTTNVSALRPNCRFTACAANVGVFNYQWTVVSGPGTITSPTNDTTTVNENATTTYQVLLMGTTQCPVTDQVTVHYMPGTPIIVNTDTVACSNVPVVRTCFATNATNAAGITWSTVNGSALSCVNCLNPTVTVNPGVYDTVIAVYNYGTGCIVTDSFVIKVNPYPTSTFTKITPVCIGANTTLTYTGTGNAAATYNWNWGTGAPAPTNSQGPHSVNWATSGWQVITLDVTANGCTSPVTSDSVYVAPTPLSPFTITSTSTVGAMANACWLDSAIVTFTGTVNNNPVATAPTYTWNFNGGIIQNAANPNSAGPFELEWNTSGVKHLSLTITQDGCSSTMSFDSVLVNPLLTSPFTIAPYPAICAGSNVTTTFTGTQNAGVAYTWTLGASPIANITSGQGTTSAQINCPNAGTLLIQMQASINGCQSPITTDSIKINPIPQASFTSTSGAACSAVPLTLTFNGTVNNGPSAGAPTYTWNFQGGTVSPGGNSAGPHTISWVVNPGSSAPTENVSLTITQDGCTSNTFVLPLVIHPYPIAGLSSADPSACSGSPIVVGTNTSITNSTNGGVVTYNWSFSNAPGGAIPGAGPQNFTWNNPLPCAENQMVYLTISQDGCASKNMDSLQVTVKSIPTASFSLAPSPVCVGTTPVLTFNGITCVNGGVVGFTWNLDGGAVSSGNPNVGGPISVLWPNTSNSTATYNPSLIVSQDGCNSAPFIAPVSIFPIPNFQISGPSQFCDGEVITLDAGVGFATYLWTTGASTHSINVNTSGTYTVNIVDANGCTSTNSKTVYSNPIPIANAGTDVEIFRGNSTMLNGTKSYGGNAYIWMPKEYVDQTTSAIPYATPPKTTPFVLTYTNDLTGCSSTDTVIVSVRECEEIFVPNAFTPNGDQVDDYFMILNPNAFYRLVRLEVYNRWGEILYSTNDKNSKGWDGKYKGVPQEVGTYMYSIIADCGGKQNVQLKGDVSLIR